MRFLSTYLAWRYLTYKGQDKNISFMVKMCFWGIFIGTFALMLTLIITNGFEKTIYEKMQGINSQILISSPGNRLDYESIASVLQKEYKIDIAAVSGSATKQAILDKDNIQSVVFLKGVDPVTEPEVTSLSNKILRPFVRTENRTKLFQQVVQDNQVIIGYKMAHENGLRVGDEITLLIPEPTGRKKIALKKQNVIVGGIFKVGLEEYDNNFAFINLDFLNQIFDEKGVDQVSIKLNAPEVLLSLKTFKKIYSSKWTAFWMWAKYKIQTTLNMFDYEVAVINHLKKRLPHLTVNSWKDLYPALVSSLKLEKYVMFFILALITLVASMNMISLLFMQIQQKRRDIAIFKAMGTNTKMIRSIFLQMGLTLTFFASTLGLTFAGIAGYFLGKYPFIKLPDVYYISHLPARMDVEIFVVVFLATMLLGFIATWFPAQCAKQIEVAQVLRQD